MPDHPMRGMPPLPAGFAARPFAHRGLHGPGRPENSLASVRAAVAAGFGIEIDLQPSADGVAMVFHDDTLDRMTGTPGPIAARPAAELSRLRLAGTAEPIPTLAAVLAEVAGRVPLLIELKAQATPEGDALLAAATAAALQGYAGPLAVMSFLPRPVAEMAARAPAVPRGLVTWAWEGAEARHPDRDRLRAIADLDALGCAFVSHDRADLDRPRLAEIRAAGLTILCWTVRSPEQERAARRHADQITFEGYLPAL